jgi:hypothetical protein
MMISTWPSMNARKPRSWSKRLPAGKRKWKWTMQINQTLARIETKAEKNPEALLSLQQPEGQGRALRGSVIAGIPQT